MYESELDFLAKIEYEGLDYCLDGYGLKSTDCPPGRVRDAYAKLERIIQSSEYQEALREWNELFEALYHA